MGGSSRHVIPVYLDGVKQTATFDENAFCNWNGLTSSIEVPVSTTGTVKLGKANHYGTVVTVKSLSESNVIVRPFIENADGNIIKTLNGIGESLTVIFNGTDWLQIADTETTATTATTGTSLTLSANLSVEGNTTLGNAAGDSITLTGSMESAQPISYDAIATVTEATSRSTGVTCNQPAGIVATNNASLAVDAGAALNVSNSFVEAGDLIMVTPLTNGDSIKNFFVDNVNNGSFQIAYNHSDSEANTDSFGFQFLVVKTH
tara:strand:+ start:1816 stop:2598 length:783 start_codon:yes stop_codon:yes gene_type:complete